MGGARWGYYALGRAGLTADNQIKAAHVQFFKGQWHERKVVAVKALGKGQAVDEALPYLMTSQKWRKLRPVADMRENNGLREKVAQSFQHLFAAPVECEPVMDESYAHGRGV